MHMLGIDVGTKKVGIAVSDDEGKVAFPLEVCPMDATLANHIVTLAKERGVTTVVLGESKNFKGEENAVMQQVLRLKASLEDFGLSVVLEPETLTSQEAKRIQGDVAGLDASAAALILQSYLDREVRNV